MNVYRHHPHCLKPGNVSDCCVFISRESTYLALFNMINAEGLIVIVKQNARNANKYLQQFDKLPDMRCGSVGLFDEIVYIKLLAKD